MSVFYYNCRGVGSNRFVCFIIHDFKKTYGVDIIAIAESRISGRAAEKIVEKLKFDVSFRVKAKSKSGGIWLLWSKIKVDMKVPKSSRHLIHILVDEGGSSPWLCSVIYVNLKDHLKRECFEEVRAMAQHISLS
jgi:hypothetical protein